MNKIVQSKLEETVIIVAREFCEKAKFFAKGEDKTPSTLEFAKVRNVSVEQHLLDQYLEALTQCHTLCDLAFTDSGFSFIGGQVIKEIESEINAIDISVLVSRIKSRT